MSDARRDFGAMRRTPPDRMHSVCPEVRELGFTSVEIKQVLRKPLGAMLSLFCWTGRGLPFYCFAHRQGCTRLRKRTFRMTTQSTALQAS